MEEPYSRREMKGGQDTRSKVVSILYDLRFPLGGLAFITIAFFIPMFMQVHTSNSRAAAAWVGVATTWVGEGMHEWRG